MREAEPADALQVSPTRIRQALSRLAAERLVNIDPNGAATVRLLDGGQACAQMAGDDVQQLQVIARTCGVCRYRSKP